MTKTYTLTEKSWLRQAGRGMWVGTEFLDHGKLMRVTGIGIAYTPPGERDRMIDLEAEEIPRDTMKLTSKGRRR